MNLDCWVEGVHFSPSGNIFAAVGHSGVIKVFEFKNEKEFEDKKIEFIENLENQQKPEAIGSPGYLSRLDLLKTELYRLKEKLSEGQFDSTILEATFNTYKGLMNYISLQWERNSD